MNQETNQNPELTPKSPAADAAVLQAGKEMKKKSAMLIISIALLIAAIVLLTYAWYTKFTSVSNIEFDLAEWDYRADYQVDDVVANVYDSAQITRQKVAPGTEGYIPVILSAEKSDADVEYFVRVNRTGMSSEFQQRIGFYYRNGDTLEDFRDKNFDNDTLIEFDKNNEDTHLLAGKITKGQEKQITVYWRWVYDLREAIQKGLAIRPATVEEARWTALKAAALDNNTSDDVFYKTYTPECDAWDEFDTKVGRHPDAYVQEMNAMLKITGAEIKPVPDNHSLESFFTFNKSN